MIIQLMPSLFGACALASELTALWALADDLSNPVMVDGVHWYPWATLWCIIAQFLTSMLHVSYIYWFKGDILDAVRRDYEKGLDIEALHVKYDPNW